MRIDNTAKGERQNFAVCPRCQGYGGRKSRDAKEFDPLVYDLKSERKVGGE